MPKIQSLTELIDEPREIAAWLVMCFSAAGLYAGYLEQWPGVTLICVALVTLLGAAAYRGVKVGPGGVEVNG